MSLAPEVITELGKPLDPARVKHREGGGGRSLSYLESHDIIRTANRVFGIGGWSYRVDELTHLGTEKFIGRDAREGTRTGYRATVTVRVNDTEYGDVGYGDATEYTASTVTTHELASKEAVSDAVKRALRNFGDQFGLCLYDKAAPEHNGRNQASAAGGGGAQTPEPKPASDAPPKFVPPVGSSMSPGGGFKWKYGPHAGLTFDETPIEYIVEYAETGKVDWLREKCKAFLAEGGGGIVDEDIPF